MNNQEILSKEYLDQLYQRPRFLGENQSAKEISHTYGEILFPSMKKLLDIAELDADDRFMDLGSGLGKIAFQTFINTSVKEVTGIEIQPHLHAYAVEAMEKIKSDFPAHFTGERKLSFIEGDFLQKKLPQASVILIGSPCFGPKLMASIGKLVTHPQSQTRLILTLKPLFNAENFIFMKSVTVEGSWDTALCHLYQRVSY